ncbi:MAG: hypothetical protein AAF311_06155 [Pseudomonadota bacterium]
MAFYRGLLVVIFLAMAIYTTPVVLNHGLNLLPIFFGDMAKMEWPGQFNFDFHLMLIMSSFYTGWREGGLKGILLGIPAYLLGATFLSAYLLYKSRGKTNIADALISRD